MIADSKFSCCWHDNSRSGAHSSCRGGNGSTLFPSTGHQCKHHLDHVKPAHLHGAHVFKQTAGEREWDRRSLDSNSGGSADAAAEGKKGRRFVNVALENNSSPSVGDAWRSPKVDLLATEQKVSVQWINRDRICLPAAHIIQQKVSRFRGKKSRLFFPSKYSDRCMSLAGHLATIVHGCCAAPRKLSVWLALSDVNYWV